MVYGFIGVMLPISVVIGGSIYWNCCRKKCLKRGYKNLSGFTYEWSGFTNEGNESRKIKFNFVANFGKMVGFGEDESGKFNLKGTIDQDVISFFI